MVFPMSISSDDQKNEFFIAGSLHIVTLCTLPLHVKQPSNEYQVTKRNSYTL
jgi:hypothetical protein